MKTSPMEFGEGQKVWVHFEGCAHRTEATVTARDKQWLAVEFDDGAGPRTLRFGYDDEEGFWYDEEESGNWVSIYTRP